jgi:hypothetical protein
MGRLEALLRVGDKLKEELGRLFLLDQKVNIMRKKYKIVYGNYTGWLKVGQPFDYVKKLDGNGIKLKKRKEAEKAFKVEYVRQSAKNSDWLPVLIRLDREGWRVLAVY